MYATVKAIGIVAAVLMSGMAGAAVGMNLGPLELDAQEVAIGCGALGVSLAFLGCHSLVRHIAMIDRKQALMRVVDRRVTRLSQSSTRSPR